MEGVGCRCVGLSKPETELDKSRWLQYQRVCPGFKPSFAQPRRAQRSQPPEADVDESNGLLSDASLPKVLPVRAPLPPLSRSHDPTFSARLLGWLSETSQFFEHGRKFFSTIPRFRMIRAQHFLEARSSALIVRKRVLEPILSIEQ